MTLTEQIKQAQIVAMKAKDKARLGAIRLAMSAIRKIEVDERRTLNDEEVLAVLIKMVKQRNDSVSQYRQAGRMDLVDIELAEIAVLAEFMPTPLTQDEISRFITDAIEQTEAKTMQDMGKVMAILKPMMQGRVDLAEVSKQIKTQLGL